MEEGEDTWLEDLERYQKRDEESYKSLTSLMVGSHYMSFQSPTYSAVKDIKKT